MTEGKTLGQLCKEVGMTLEELAEGMKVSERDLMLLESSGQKYLGLDPEWFALLTERYGYEKVFWYPPEKAVREWEMALRLLNGFTELACNTLDSEPLIAILGDATTRAQQELAGCRELLANFERQEEQIRSEMVED